MLMVQHIIEIESKVMSISGVEIIQQKEDVSTVRYAMLFKSTRQSTSMLILVSLTN